MTDDYDDDDDKDYITVSEAQIPHTRKTGDFPHNRLAKLYNEDTHLILCRKETLQPTLSVTKNAGF